MLSVAGTRYAKALLDVVPPQEAQRTLEQLRSISELISASTDLHVALLSPAVTQSRKRAVIARLLDPMGVSRPVRNFLFVVIDHRRVNSLPAMLEAFEVLLDERSGFVRADVESAHELDASQRASLEAELSRLSGKKAKIAFAIQPNLIGGAIARVQGKVYDGSVRGQLERLRIRLASE